MEVHPEPTSPRPTDTAPTLDTVIDDAMAEQVQDLVAEFGNGPEDEQDALDSIVDLDSRMFEDLAALSNSIQAEQFELSGERSAQGQDDRATHVVESQAEERQPSPHIDPTPVEKVEPAPAAAPAPETPTEANEPVVAGPSTKRSREKTIDASEDAEEEEEDGDKEDMDNDSEFGDGGKVKRRRNRAALSCTECHRRKQQCDRKVPCNRCIKRGLASMCRMEMPAGPVRKKRKRPVDWQTTLNTDLQIQALQTLISSGSSLEGEEAAAAARDTIRQATRAMQSGSRQATNALAKLTQSATEGPGIDDMSQDARAVLLNEVLKQLSSASMTARAGSVEQGARSDDGAEEAWSAVPKAPSDSVAQIASAFEEDSHPDKLNLSLSGLRGDDGRLFIPPSVQRVRQTAWADGMFGEEPLSARGHTAFIESALELAFGAESKALKQNRISAVQATSITGALRIAATFLSRFPVESPQKYVYRPNVTSREDLAVLHECGLELRTYPLLDRKTGEIDWDGIKSELQSATPHSIVLLSAGGFEPSGADLIDSHWRTLVTVLNKRQLVPLVIMPSQGLASGDPDEDARHVRYMVDQGVPLVLLQGFDAILGLYSDSPAVVSVLTDSPADRRRVDSQLQSIARTFHVHASPWGAQVASSLLSDGRYVSAWRKEIKAMSARLQGARKLLFDTLTNKLKTPSPTGDWSPIQRSVGLYSMIFLRPSDLASISVKRHIYLLPDGCVSLGCLTASKVEALARSIDYVIRQGIREREEAAAQEMAMQLALDAAREQAAREEAEAAALAEAAAEEAAREEDNLLMARSIADAMEAAKNVQEDERRRMEEEKAMEAAIRKAAEREEMLKHSEAILAQIRNAEMR